MFYLSDLVSLAFQFEFRGDQVDTYPGDLTTSDPNLIDEWRQRSWNDFKSNYGAGKNWNESIGSFNTFSYGLHRIIFNRLRLSPLRTRNIEEATVKFIPYDMGETRLFLTYV